ncbi:MAG: carboxypeptidase-like regulatory domain-containing protein [Bacteroidota bacterium]
MKRFILIGLLFFSIKGIAQEKILTGVIYEENQDGSVTPLPFVNVLWAGTSIGTSSNHKGLFQIPYDKVYRQLVVSFIGYTSDTLLIENNKDIDIVLKNLKTLETVEIVHRRRGTEISLMDPIISQNLNKKELRKAACCNLAESFETNASVDASYSNAVTGRHQIKMLGLDGKYVQIMEDNIPYIRGLAVYEGLEYIPGSWINAIQISKAAGSVVNGFESITGQINVNMKQPDNAEDLHINLFANAGSRLEGNINFNYPVAAGIKGTFLAHVKNLSQRIDRNDDGFIDNALSDHYVFQNNFKLEGENFNGEIGLKVTLLDHQSGQMEFTPENIVTSFYGVVTKTRRAEAYSKTGIIFPNSDYASLGLQLKGVYHDQEAMFGRRNYLGEEQTFSANLIYQDAFSDRHKFKTGFSFLYDDYKEQVFDGVAPLVSNSGTPNFSRTEKVPGVFFEYTIDGKDIYNVIAGIRVDEHNIYGTLINGRINARYALDARTALKIALGKGQRISNIFNENMDLIVSSRQFYIDNPGSGAYGLDMEEATTIGVNFTQKFELFNEDASFLLDFYNTNFINQIVVDLDAHAQEVHFYNLDGKSYSNSVQAELHFEPKKRLELRMAARWMDVQTQYSDEQLQVPFNPELRGFFNVGYITRKNKRQNRWMLDATLQYVGKQRLPSTRDNPLVFQRPDFADAYPLLNIQGTRMLGDDVEIYLGVENAFDYRQTDPIIQNTDPFGEYFDANFAYAPVFGRNIYLGFRYTILGNVKRNEEGGH